MLEVSQSYRAAGVEFFQDILSLEPGTRWEEGLYREIDRVLAIRARAVLVGGAALISTWCVIGVALQARTSGPVEAAGTACCLVTALLTVVAVDRGARRWLMRPTLDARNTGPAAIETTPQALAPELRPVR